MGYPRGVLRNRQKTYLWFGQIDGILLRYHDLCWFPGSWGILFGFLVNVTYLLSYVSLIQLIGSQFRQYYQVMPESNNLVTMQFFEV